MSRKPAEGGACPRDSSASTARAALAGVVALGRKSSSVSVGCTILLLEDEPLILMDLELAAQDNGCCCLIATRTDHALAHLHKADPLPDVAVLDVTLQNSETCLPVARELERLGIPYILHSGDLDRQNENIRQLDAPLLPKPASSASVIAAAMACLNTPPRGRAATG